jgi:hypothetical protein
MPAVNVIVARVSERDIDVIERILPEGLSDCEIEGYALGRERDIVDSTKKISTEK